MGNVYKNTLDSRDRLHKAGGKIKNIVMNKETLLDMDFIKTQLGLKTDKAAVEYALREISIGLHKQKK
jgi:hypothetical protein